MTCHWFRVSAILPGMTQIPGRVMGTVYGSHMAGIFFSLLIEFLGSFPLSSLDFATAWWSQNNQASFMVHGFLWEMVRAAIFRSRRNRLHLLRDRKMGTYRKGTDGALLEDYQPETVCFRTVKKCLIKTHKR